MPLELDIFETPVTVTPQQKISKTLNLPKFLEILNVYFWGDNAYFWGDNVYFWGNKGYYMGILEEFRLRLNWPLNHLQNGKRARSKNPGKMGKKMENGPGPEMAGSVNGQFNRKV